MTCAVSAYPEPTVFYWLHDDVPLTQSDKTHDKYKGGNLLQTSLTILDVVEGEDSGIYSCVAENGEGVSTSPGIELKILVGEWSIDTARNHC